MRINNKLSFYFVTTDHLTESIWFRDEQDFKVGMNYIAIISLLTGIKVLAFVLMSNHVHIVLQCSEAEAIWFINELKRRYSEYLSRRYGTVEFLRRNKTDIQEVKFEGQSLERAIAYTLMNPVSANICLNASDYPWSSASSYFKVRPSKGILSRDLSRRARRRLLHTKSDIPGETMIGEYGYILPESYIPVGFVESIFRSPKRLNYFMVNSSKAKKRLNGLDSGVPSFKDQVILAAVPDICRTVFKKRSVSELSAQELAELIFRIRRSFFADVSQIARVIGVSYSDVAGILESI